MITKFTISRVYCITFKLLYPKYLTAHGSTCKLKNSNRINANRLLRWVHIFCIFYSINFTILNVFFKIYHLITFPQCLQTPLWIISYGRVYLSAYFLTRRSFTLVRWPWITGDLHYPKSDYKFFGSYRLVKHIVKKKQKN